MCAHPAELKGVLAEAQDLLRAALDHRSPAPELTAWFSQLVFDCLRSPAAADLLAGSTIAPTGSVARGEAMPSMPLEWIVTSGSGSDALTEVFAHVGLQAHAVESRPALRIDARLAHPTAAEPELLQLAVDHRPPSVSTQDGLPDRSAPVALEGAIMRPVADLARWAAAGQAGQLTATPDRLAAGTSNGLLTEDESAALLQAWTTGLTLCLRRWAGRVSDREVTLGDLPAIDRSAYGDAARTVSTCIRAVAARHDIAVTEKGSWS
ncbi:hypothetical protein GCM10028828_00470 [Corynebacterium tapiri]